MVAYFTGDRPVDAIIVPVVLGEYSAASGSLIRPDGSFLALEPAVDVETGEISVELPIAGGSPFTVDGLYRVRLTLERPAAEGKPAGSRRLSDIDLVVQSDDGWFDLDAARRAWQDAPEDDGALFRLLEISKIDVLAYAPALVVGRPVPLNYREAQIMQARNRWNAFRVDPSGAMGDGGFSFTPFPLDWQIRQLLRPRNPRPAIA